MAPKKTGLADRAHEYSSKGIILEDKNLVCKHCGIMVPNTKTQIEQHLGTGKHRKNVSVKTTFQTLPALDAESEFTRDVCKVLVGCNIPIHKLRNPILKDFLEKYTKRTAPTESTIRRSYLQSTYEESIQNIRAKIGENPIWISIDETTDSEGRFVANVIVGALRKEYASPGYLIHSVQLQKTNSTSISQTINEALSLLWPTGIKHNLVYLLVTDAAAYMKKAGKHLQKILFPRMIHITCLAHGMHNLAEFIRDQFPKADALISENKKIFRKAPQRKQFLEEKYSDLKIPPFPVLTRWGTWLTAVKYYATEWNRIKDVVSSLNDDAASIIKAKQLYEDEEVFAEISFVFKHYVFLADIITQLETSQQPISVGLEHLNTVMSKIAATPNKAVKDKLDQIIEKNTGLRIIQAISKNDIATLNTFAQFKSLAAPAAPADIAIYEYSPLVSCDVERSFNNYKNILTDNRRSFKFENLAKHLVIACNLPYVDDDVFDVSDDEDD